MTLLSSQKNEHFQEAGHVHPTLFPLSAVLGNANHNAMKSSSQRKKERPRSGNLGLNILLIKLYSKTYISLIIKWFEMCNNKYTSSRNEIGSNIWQDNKMLKI